MRNLAARFLMCLARQLVRLANWCLYTSHKWPECNHVGFVILEKDEFKRLDMIEGLAVRRMDID